MVILDPELNLIKVNKVAHLRESVVYHLMAWLGKYKGAINKKDTITKLMYCSNYSTMASIALQVNKIANEGDESGIFYKKRIDRCDTVEIHDKFYDDLL